MAAPARRRVLLSLPERSGTLNDIIGPSWPRPSSGPPPHWLKGRASCPAPFGGGSFSEGGSVSLAPILAIRRERRQRRASLRFDGILLASNRFGAGGGGGGEASC